MSLLTASIVSAAISSKTGFTEWHASKVGWVCYAHDFPKTWSRCDLIIGTFSSVPIKRGVVEAIGAATPIGNSKEKKIKQEAVKRVEPEESTEGIEASPKTKKRKTSRSQKQLVIYKEPERVSPPIVGKEVGHPLIPRT